MSENPTSAAASAEKKELENNNVAPFVPTTMRTEATRYVILSRRYGFPFFIDKGSSGSEALADTFRQALDLSVAVAVTLAPINNHHVVSASIVWPQNFKTPSCPESPTDVSPDFWKNREAGREQQDRVAWVTKREGCAIYEISFHRGHGVYRVHENQPLAAESIANAWKSINEDVPVTFSCDKHAPNWISKLSLSTPL